MKKGFTLIELLVVIAVIGLLASIILVNMKGTTYKAKVSKALQFSQSVHHALGVDAVGVWDFDEGSGTTARDSSGHGNNGTINGAVYDCTDTPYHVVGSGSGKCALRFDGNDYVNIPSNSILNPTDAITVSAWVKSAVNSGYPGVWQIVSNYSAYILGSGVIGSKSMCFIVLTYGGNWSYGNCYTVSDPENWHHFVGIYDKSISKVKLYVDGVLRSTITYSGNIRDGGGLHIGHRECCAEYFNGLIDEVRIYNRALSIGEIQKLYVEGAARHQIA